MAEVWDPHGSLRRRLWIGGAQWAGKTTVSELLARQFGLTVYHYDYHDARGHQDRRIARRAAGGAGRASGGSGARAGLDGAGPGGDGGRDTGRFPLRFEWALDDLRALSTGRPAIAEGWGLRPELVAPLLDSVRRMVVLVPTEDFRQHQIRTVPRAGALGVPVSDPARAQANRLARDRLVAEDAVRGARRLGVPVIEVDGTRDAAAVASLVAEQFAPGWGRRHRPAEACLSDQAGIAGPDPKDTPTALTGNVCRVAPVVGQLVGRCIPILAASGPGLGRGLRGLRR